MKNAHAYSTLARAIAKLPYLHWPPEERKINGSHCMPHGRLATVFIIVDRYATCPRYVDLSVMPRA